MEMGYKDKAATEGQKKKNGLLEPEIGKSPDNKAKKSPDYLPQHFSYSQLAAFEKCPLQYKFNFILKVPIKGKAVFSFGKTMHGTFYEFLKSASEKSKNNQTDLFGFQDKKSKAVKEEGSLNLEDLLEIYEKNWIGEWYENKNQKDEYYKLGKKIVKDFYQEYIKNPPKILKVNDSLALEIPFNLKIGEHTLYGVIDRIDEKDGKAVIIDYKTGNSKDKLLPEDKEQLLIYQIAAEEIFKSNPKELVYYYLNDGKKASFLGSELEKENLKVKIEKEIGEIKRSSFDPTPGWQCSFCDFKEICDFAQRQ
jgi:DNA helicase-2/ATP-dependent DNA helicase PcrA